MMDDSKFNKLLNEKYYLLQDIAKKYNYNEELLDMITLIYISFYMDFEKGVTFHYMIYLIKLRLFMIKEQLMIFR